MVFDELSNAFFRFPLRCAGAELVGGASRRPPPPPPGAAKVAPSTGAAREIHASGIDRPLGIKSRLDIDRNFGIRISILIEIRPLSVRGHRLTQDLIFW